MGATDPEFIEMVAAEGGILAAVLLAILVPAIIAMFVVMKAFVTRILDRQEKLISELTTAQNTAIATLSESVARVEKAVIRSDGHNTASIEALGVNLDTVKASITAHGALHEKHDARFASHDSDIKTLSGSHTLLDYRATSLEKRLPNP